MKIFLIILFSFLGLILLVFLLTLILVKIRIVYDGELSVRIGALFFSHTLFPRKKRLGKKKRGSPVKEKHKKEKKASKQKKTATKPKTDLRRMASLYTDLLREVILPFSAKLGRRLHVKIKRLSVVIGTEDAGRTAALYGVAVASLTALLEMLRGAVILKIGRDRDVGVYAAFDRTETVCSGEIQIAVRPLSVLTAGVPALIRYLKIRQASERQNDESQRSEH